MTFGRNNQNSPEKSFMLQFCVGLFFCTLVYNQPPRSTQPFTLCVLCLLSSTALWFNWLLIHNALILLAYNVTVRNVFKPVLGTVQAAHDQETQVLELEQT